MNTTSEIRSALRRLRISGALDSFGLRMEEAVDDSLPYDEFFLRVLQDELSRREQKSLLRRIQKARFDGNKRLEDFDFEFNPQIPKSKIIDLATCNFIGSATNVLLVGQAGVGKTHLAQALGQRACRLGRTVLYSPFDRLLKKLRSSRADGTYDRHLRQLAKLQLLIIDDVGLRPLRDNEPEDLYEIIRMRYELGSIVLTSNRAIEELYGLFGDPLLASTAMDRLLHHSTVIEIEGNSYRTPKRHPKRQKVKKRIDQIEEN